MIRILAGFIDCALNRYAPIVHARSYAAMSEMGGAEKLAEAEANTEVWEPNTEDETDWKLDFLRDFYVLPDGDTIDDFVTDNRHLFTQDQPAGTVASPPTASGPGGFPNSVAHVIAVTLRSQGINSAPIYADLIARELAHHFTIQPK